MPENISPAMHGFGVYRYSDGQRYEGAWREGNRKGLGMCSSAYGEPQSGLWDDDFLKISSFAVNHTRVLDAVQVARTAAEKAYNILRVDDMVNRAVAAAENAANAAAVASSMAIQMEQRDRWVEHDFPMQMASGRLFFRRVSTRSPFLQSPKHRCSKPKGKLPFYRVFRFAKKRRRRRSTTSGRHQRLPASYSLCPGSRDSAAISSIISNSGGGDLFINGLITQRRRRRRPLATAASISSHRPLIYLSRAAALRRPSLSVQAVQILCQQLLPSYLSQHNQLGFMGKHKDDGVSANWEANDVLIFCDLCLKEIELGNRPTTHFSRDGWNNLTTHFHARTGKAYDRTQMKNKWDQLKKDWKLWRDLKGRETGLGWDPIRKTIFASEDWWKDRLKVFPSARKFQFAGISPELEEKLHMMFSQVVANGDLAWAPNSRIFEHESVDEHDGSPEHATQGSDDIEDTTAKLKRAAKGKSTKIAAKKSRSSALDELVETSRIIGRCMQEPPRIQISSSLYTIPEAISELETMPEVMADSNMDFYHYCIVFLRQKQNRESFMSMRQDRRLTWLQDCYHKKLE
ncbi:hypothetical protein KSP39_PZI008015 [Platanthera zijinensis]|uniref:Myb/SANT-like domain-containing protein n=1 Tax=Platanthera zijinensis TaxID=2320716 RepID=A0AAP0BN56_9ASPA